MEINHNHKYNLYQIHELGIDDTTSYVRGIKIGLSVPWGKPKWKSHAGLNGHVKALVERGLDRLIATLILCFTNTTTDDLNKILQVPAGIRDKFLSMFNPFVHNLCISDAILWMTKFSTWDLHRFDNMAHICRMGHTATMTSALEWFVNEFKLYDGHTPPEILKRMETIQYFKFNTQLERTLYLLFGCVSPSMVAFFKDGTSGDIETIHKFIEKNNLSIRQIDFNRFRESKSLVVAGIRHKDTYLWDLNLPKVERIEIINGYLSAVGDQVCIAEYRNTEFDLFKTLCSKFGVLEVWRNYTWMSYSASPFNDNHLIRLCKWIKRNESKLVKTQTVHGPGGTTVEMHYHTLIQHIRPDMLPSSSTKFSKVMDAIKIMVQDQLRASLNDPTVTLNVVDIPYPKYGVIPIKNVGELINEGNVMDHCVAGYASHCISGQTAILHIGRPAPKGATAEISLRNGECVLHQLRGHDNDPPASECIELVHKFIADVNKNKSAKLSR